MSTANHTQAQAKPTQATLLMQMAADADIFHDPEGTGYATVPVADHRETCAILSKQFRTWLEGRYLDNTEQWPCKNAMQQTIEHLDGVARHRRAEHPVFIRVAENRDTIYLDLGDAAWRAVRITAEGWEVVTRPVVRFRRTKTMGRLPEPVRGGSLETLRTIVNVADAGWPLFKAWLVQSVRPRGPYPPMILLGEQSTAKTTTQNAARRLIDPATKAESRGAPRDVRDLAIAANGGWVLAFDNLSGTPTWLSDALCRVSTGGGFGTRTLCTDGDETVFDFQRPMILNGIGDVATRPDLIDRAIILTGPVISESARRTEAEIWSAFDCMHAAVLGALLDAVAEALRNVNTVAVPNKLRMADFCIWATAAEPALGLSSGEFMRAYRANREGANDSTLAASAFCTALIELVRSKGTWQGSASELLSALAPDGGWPAGQRPDDWPKAANQLPGVLQRFGPLLRAAGVTVTDAGKRPKTNVKMVALTYRDATTAAGDAS